MTKKPASGNDQLIQADTPEKEIDITDLRNDIDQVLKACQWNPLAIFSLQKIVDEIPEDQIEFFRDRIIHAFLYLADARDIGSLIKMKKRFGDTIEFSEDPDYSPVIFEAITKDVALGSFVTRALSMMAHFGEKITIPADDYEKAAAILETSVKEGYEKMMPPQGSSDLIGESRAYNASLIKEHFGQYADIGSTEEELCSAFLAHLRSGNIKDAYMIRDYLGRDLDVDWKSLDGYEEAVKKGFQFCIDYNNHPKKYLLKIYEYFGEGIDLDEMLISYYGRCLSSGSTESLQELERMFGGIMDFRSIPHYRDLVLEGVSASISRGIEKHLEFINEYAKGINPTEAVKEGFLRALKNTIFIIESFEVIDYYTNGAPVRIDLNDIDKDPLESAVNMGYSRCCEQRIDPQWNRHPTMQKYFDRKIQLIEGHFPGLIKDPKEKNL